MLRTLICASALALTALTGAASAEQFPASSMGMEIVGDDGAVLGHVSAVQRNAQGRIIAIGAEGLDAPAEAPRARTPQNPPRQERLPPYRPALIAMEDQNDRAQPRN